MPLFSQPYIKVYVLFTFIVAILFSAVSGGLVSLFHISNKFFGMIGILLTGFGIGFYLALPFIHKDLLHMIQPSKKFRAPFLVYLKLRTPKLSYPMITFFLLILANAYIAMRFFSLRGLGPIEIFIGAGLFLSEAIVMLYVYTFFAYSSISIFKPYKKEERLTSTLHYKVAIVVPIYNEPPQTIEKAFHAISKLKYHNLEMIAVDDSDEDLLANTTEALAKKYGFTYLRRKERKGYKAGALNYAVSKTNADIIVVFDADHRPGSNFLLKTIPHFSDEKVALVQTPQYFTRLSTRTSDAAEKQQAIFYWMIAPGKEVTGSMFCVGTNFAVKRKVLEEVRGFPEDVLTEDIALSYSLSMKGYKIKYLNEVVAYGESPPNLRAYFRQQARWAYGSTQLTLRILREFVSGKLSNMKNKLEYFVSAAWFPLMGAAHVFMLATPIIYVLFQLKSVVIDPLLYAIIYLAYSGAWSIFFYEFMIFGRARRRSLWLGQALLNITALTWFISASKVFIGRRMVFSKTIRASERMENLRLQTMGPMIPQLLTYTFLIFTFVIGMNKLIFWTGSFYNALSLVVNLIWILFFISNYLIIFLFLEE